MFGGRERGADNTFTQLATIGPFSRCGHFFQVALIITRATGILTQIILKKKDLYAKKKREGG